jgi:DNA polymerase I-like protein with 3'-5' exonuclease and polymerase domains
LIQPEPGRAIAYVDWSQQEFGIAGALSGDLAMMKAYASGDPYLAFGKQAGVVPQQATKESHRRERELFKTCALGVQYGMGARSLAFRIGEPEIVARNLLQLHRETYSTFWKWVQAAVDHAMLRGWVQTVFGWRIHVGPDANPRSLLNFPMQANGADMLRLACCLITECGIAVCWPIHDAVLIEANETDINTAVANTQALMAEASGIVLKGFTLRTEAEFVRWPDRYMDRRGTKMWDTVMTILDELDHPDGLGAGATPTPSADVRGACVDCIPGLSCF